MKLSKTDVLDRLYDEDFDSEENWEVHKHKNRRTKSMRNEQSIGDPRKQGRRRIQQARNAKQRETLDLE